MKSPDICYVNVIEDISFQIFIVISLLFHIGS